MAVGLLALVVVPTSVPAQNGAPAIDPSTLLSEQPLRTWQVMNLQDPAESELPDWDVLVWDFAEINGVMYVGGRFQNVRRYSGATEHDQAFLAAFDVQTGEWIPSFRPVLDDGVYSLAVAPGGNRLLVGGEFTNVNGAPLTAGFAALDPFTGEPDPNFKLSVSREVGAHMVKDIEVLGNDVYIGGRFNHVQDQFAANPVRRYSLAKIDGATGALDGNWDVPASGGRVMALGLSPDGEELYVGGFFTSLGQALDTKWMAMVRTADAVVVPLTDPVPPDGKFYVFDLDVSEDKVFAGSEWHRLWVYDRDSLELTHDYHTSGYGGDYQAIHRAGDVVWVGGHFHGYEDEFGTNGYRRQVQWLTAYDLNTAEPIEGWVARIGMKDGVFAITEDSEGKLWVGGDPSSGATVPLQGFTVFPHRSAETEQNLARNQSTTQSSDGASGIAWRGRSSEVRCDGPVNQMVGPSFSAVDGKTAGGAWECSFSATEAELAPWWQVDLGATGEVDMIRIWNMTSTGDPEDLTDPWIAVSEDPDAINSTDPVALAADPAVTLAQISGQVPWFQEVPIGAYGRYVRVFTNNAEPTQLRLAEVEVLDLDDATPPPPDLGDLLVADGASWRYLDNGSAAPAGWNNVGFDDGAWPEGPSMLGFGDDDIATVTAPGATTTYMRHTFSVADPAAVAGLALELLADDGAVAYLNGVEIHRLRMPAGPISAQTTASDTVWGAAERAWNNVAVPAGLLNAGANVLAVELHNNWSGGGDLAGSATLTTSDNVVEPPAVDQLLVPIDASWRYLDTGVDPGSDWVTSDFDDAAWVLGQAELGYGDGDEVTVVNEGPAPDRHITTWFRTTFDVDDLADIAQLDLGLVRDDGAVVYLNGVEQVRSNMPDGPITAATLASDYAWGPGERDPQPYSIPTTDLVAGTNTVAVEIHSASTGSRDVSFALEIIGVAP
jgi:hypothetical protein